MSTPHWHMRDHNETNYARQLWPYPHHTGGGATTVLPSDIMTIDDWNWEMRWAKNSTAGECCCMKGPRPHGAEEIWMTESNTTLSLR
jgi:hypothetical protein